MREDTADEWLQMKEKRDMEWLKPEFLGGMTGQGYLPDNSQWIVRKKIIDSITDYESGRTMTRYYQPNCNCCGMNQFECKCFEGLNK